MPQNIQMADDLMEAFVNVSKATDEIAEKERYEIVDRLETWMKRGQELVTKRTGHFSQYGMIDYLSLVSTPTMIFLLGVRTINDLLVNKLSIILNRTYRKQDIPKKSPVDQFMKRADAAGWFGNDRPARRRYVSSQPHKRFKI